MFKDADVIAAAPRSDDTAGSAPSIDISVVLPCYNEAQNVRPLFEAIRHIMDSLERSWEVVWVDDGSTDETYPRLAELSKRDGRVTVVRLRRNFGQTAALQAGFDAARGQIIVSMDADFQHDPQDIPVLIAKLEEGYDIVSGWRKARADHWLTRKLPSRVANHLMSKLSGVAIHDFGTTLKAYRRDVVENLELAPGHHRFIPALASAIGIRVTEVPIRNVVREKGKSNYGLGRILPVLFDLILIKFLLTYASRPMQLFGLLGFISFSLGFVLASGIAIAYYFGSLVIATHYGNLLLAVFLMLLGIQFFGIGLLAELTVRVYRRVTTRKLYTVRSLQRTDEAITRD